jgi:putative ABC transport system permease protein
MTPMAIQRPPRIPRRLLRWLNRGDAFLAMVGDFDEEFLEIGRTEGPAAARRWYWRQFARSLPGSLKENVMWRLDMAGSYVRLAVRNLLRQKALSTVNVLGLSIALACGLWIYLFIADELSYNRCHENAAQLYSIVNTDNFFPYTYRSIPSAVGPAAAEFFPEVERTARLALIRGAVRRGGLISQERVSLADPAFLEMFTFRLVRGDRRALADRDAIFLTRSSAAKYFGRDDPLGQSLTVAFDQGSKDFRVAGVLEDPPANSTVRFQFLVSILNSELILGSGVLDRWTGAIAETYVQLKSGADAAAVDARFPEFVGRYFARVIEDRKARGAWNKDGETITFWLQNIRDIHLQSRKVSGEPRANAAKSVVLGLIGLLLLAVAGINFSNLAAGRASRRAVEIAVRRVLGSDRKSLLRQFWGESIVTVAFSMALGLVLAGAFLPLFNSIAGKSFRPADLATPPIAGLVVGLMLGVGVLAGSYPALVLAGANPVRIFKGDRRIGGKNLFSRALLVFQFSIAALLVIATLVMSRQIRYIQDKDLGFNSRDLIVIDNQERDPAASAKAFRLFREEASTLAPVSSVGGCVFLFAEAPGEGTLQYKDKRLRFLFSSVSPGYFDTLGMTFLEGADFPSEPAGGPEPVIVNERFVRQAGIERPVGELIGTPGRSSRIIGVVKDYHFLPLQFEVGPVLHFLSQRVSTILVRTTPGGVPEALLSLEALWERLRPDKPFVYKFLDSLIADRYTDERRWNAIVRVSSVLVILITAMGLVGLTTVMTGRRVREVGVRRVLGATKASLCLRLSGDLLFYGLGANVLAWPVGYVVMRQWLNRYPYRTGLPAEAFVLAGVLSFLIIVATIGVLVFKTASVNPAETLRSE